MDQDPIVRCEHVFKIYQFGEVEVVALQGLDLEVAAGEMMALVGPSGVGKSTLLNVIGGLDTPSAGEVHVAGWDLRRMAERERVEYKRQVVGFVWQQPARNLLPYLSARENVELPMQYNPSLGGVEPAARRARALELLDVVGLARRADFRPDRLSGGEQQRAALAVALANNPPLLLGDELTGQVDSASAMQVLDALRAINQAYGTAAIVVTHDPLVASRMDRVVTMRDGRTSTEIRRHDEEEWVILDQAGRLQLPRGYVNTLEMRERVRVHLAPDHVSVWPQSVSVWPQSDSDSSQVDEAVLLRDEMERVDTGADSLEQMPAGGVLPPGEPAAAGPGAGVPIVVQDLARTFELAGEEVHALQDVSLEIPAGTLTVIKGPSGSGKTTLLSLLAGLDEPTAGVVRIGGQPLAEMSPEDRTDLRRRQIGYVFQTFGLLPFLTVEENVEVPLRLLRMAPEERSTLVEQALHTVGLAERARHRTYELSGGEQQRVAIARALVKRPDLILADEPTGQLDSVTGAGIITLLKEIAARAGITVVVASHDPNVHEAADRLFELCDGQLVEARERPAAARAGIRHTQSFARHDG